MRRVVPLVLILPALLAGCLDSGDPSHLSRTSWRFVSIDGRNPHAADARLTFDQGDIGVQVGCNRIGGPWRIDRDRLFAGPLAQTELACTGPAWNQEKAVGALLVATPRMSVSGDRMTLHSNGHAAELVREDATLASR